MWLDQWATWCLIALALWILLSGLDDLFIILVHMRLARRPFAWPSQDELAAEPERRIAVLVPLWHEDGVIEQMLAQTETELFRGQGITDLRDGARMRRNLEGDKTHG